MRLIDYNNFRTYDYVQRINRRKSFSNIEIIISIKMETIKYSLIQVYRLLIN